LSVDKLAQIGDLTVSKYYLDHSNAKKNRIM
jgi:hypothetical protein